MKTYLATPVKKFASLFDWHWAVFLTLAIVFGLISIFSLRQNNLTMISLRNEVYAADKNNGNTNEALDNLRRYVYSHMNTDLTSGDNAIKPPIQLKYTYERLVAAEKSKINQANAKIYTDAQAYCERQNSESFSGRSRVPCIEDYVSSHGLKTQPIPDALYKFDFVSPAWSSDLAGWSLIGCVVFFLAFAVSFVFDRWMKMALKQSVD